MVIIKKRGILPKITFATVKTVDIDKLIEPAYNDRHVIDSKKAESFWRAISEYGIVELPVWNKRTGHLVGGAWRVEQLRSEGVKRVKVCVIDIVESKERKLNDLLNSHAREFELEKRREKIKAFFKDDVDIGYLSLKEQLLYVPEVKPIQLPDRVFEPRLNRVDDSTPAKVDTSEDFTPMDQGSAAPDKEESSYGHLITFVLEELDYQLLQQCKDLYGVKTDHNIIMKGIKALLEAKEKKRKQGG